MPRCARYTPTAARSLRGFAGWVCAICTLLAVGTQLAIPGVHLLHDRITGSHQHADAHHEHGDGDTDHDDASCPTCQLFASLRSFTPVTSASAISGIDSLDSEPSIVHVAPPLERLRLTPASPRAPPLA